MFDEFAKSFISLFIIIDPFVSAAFFVGFAKDMDSNAKRKAIWTAISVAAALLLIFLFGGLFALQKLGISFNGFMIAGGIILLILGITQVFGIDLSSKKNVKSAALLIGTPLLSGPGALTTITILSNHYGYYIPGLAAITVLIISWIILFYADKVAALIGTEMIEVFSKILGLLVSAMAVDFIYTGIKGFIGG